MNYELKEDYELCTMNYELKDYAVFFEVSVCPFVRFGHKKQLISQRTVLHLHIIYVNKIYF